MTKALKTITHNAFISDAAQQDSIRLAELANTPEELVEKCRTNAHSSQLLQDFCQRIIDSNKDEGTRLMAMGVRTALRANVRFELAYRWHIQQQKPEYRNLTLARFKEVYALAILAYHTGNAVLHNGMVISNRYAEKLMHDERVSNASWIGTHVTAISVLDRLCHDMKEAIEQAAKDMPRGWSPVFSLLRIRIENLLEKSRKNFDSHVNATIFSTYPFATGEWIDEGISGTLHCESIIYDHFAKETPITVKALVIAMQKQKEDIPYVKAYLYMMFYIIKGVIEKAEKLEKEMDDTKMADQPNKASFHKDWKSLMDQAIQLRNCICRGRKDLTISGEYANMAEDRCEKMLDDITERLAYRIIKHADMTVILQYTDFSLAQIMLRLRRKEGLPLSWAIALRKIMGNKSDFRKAIGQMRNPKLLPGIPDDDAVDAGEFLTELLSPMQEVRMDEDENGDIQIMVQQTEKKLLNSAIGRIVLLREHMLDNQWGKPDWIPTDRNKRYLDELTRRLYKDGLMLTDDNLAWLFSIAESMNGMKRMLKAVGPMGNRTRSRLAKMHLRDIDNICQENVVATYRKRGYEIPAGMGRLFLNELAHLGQMENEKTKLKN